MTSKEKYERPSAEIISFEDGDIIRTSDTKMPKIISSESVGVSSFY